MEIIQRYNIAEEQPKRSRLLLQMTISDSLFRLLIGTGAGCFFLLQPILQSLLGGKPGQGSISSYYIAAILLTLAALTIFGFAQYRSRLLAEDRNFIIRAMISGQLEKTIHITSEKITLADFESSSSFLWSKFPAYRIYKGWILLYLDKLNAGGIMIEMSRLSESEVQDLALLLRSKQRLHG